MAFEIVQKPAFYHDLISLPRDVQKSIPAAVRHISADPFRANGHSKPCLKHLYRNLYRYRVKGDYRLVYSVGDGCVCLLGIAQRREAYTRFYPDARDSPPHGVNASSAEPRIIPTTAYDTFASVDAGHNDVDGDAADEDYSSQGVSPDASARGAAEWLLEELLEHWGVAAEYRQPILQSVRLISRSARASFDA